MIKKQFFVDNANNIHWDKRARTGTWQDGPHHVFLADGLDKAVTALVHPKGLYFYGDFIVDLIRSTNSHEAVKQVWNRGGSHYDILDLLPEQIRLDQLDGNREIHLNTQDIPAELLKEALSRAFSSNLVAPFQ